MRPGLFIVRNFNGRCNAIANTKDDEPRVNSEIRSPEVLLIDEMNAKRGVVSIQEALKLAEAAELDLVEVAPQAKPPVCRIMNYGKYRFQQQKRDKDARKKQKNQVVKEIKMRPKIDLHDYEFKVKAIKAFLQDGHRVKVSIFFRGREMAFLDRGRDVLNKVLEAVSDYGKIEMEPRMEGAYMRIMIAPAADAQTKKQAQKKLQKPAGDQSDAPAQPAQAKPQKVKKNVLPDADQI
ncbi:translation initiation factor IF-3 [Cloacibacillus sp. An23]|nr:translation initiation factor IF-3 [Cloacibacillus sp. An23]